MKFIKDHIIPNIVWVCLASIPTAYISIKNALGIFILISQNMDRGSIPLTDWILTIICLIVNISCMIMCVISIYIIRKEKKHAAEDVSNITLARFDDEYRLIDVTMELYFKTARTLKVTQTVNFEVLADNLNTIPHTITWTGQTYLGAHLRENSIEDGYELVNSLRTYSPYEVLVKFPNKKKGDTGSYSWVIRFEDGTDNGEGIKYSMIPAIGKTIRSITDKLTLRVVAPPNIISDVKSGISFDFWKNDLCANSPEELIQPKEIGELIYYEWIVDKPEVLRTYVLDWKFLNQ